MMGNDAPEELLPDQDPKMYVMTNESKINGAAAMIFTDKIDEFANEQQTNFFILPSSVHEVLLIPDTGEINVNELEDMVKSVNRTQVSPDEVLSDNVYFYDREEKNLCIATTKEPLVLECVSKDSEKAVQKNAEKSADRNVQKTSEKKAADKATRESEEPKSIKDRLAEGKEKSAMSLENHTDKHPQERGI